MVLETTYVTPTGTAVVVDALATGEGNRGHELGHDAPHLLLRQVTCTRGRGRAGGRVRPATRVRPGRPVARRRRRRTASRPAAPMSWCCRARAPLTRRPVVRLGSVGPCVRASGSASRCITASGPTPGRPGSGARTRSRSRLDDTIAGVAVVVGAAPGLRRAVARPRPPQRAGAPGAVVPTDRRDLRGGHHLVARGRRRRPQLGLPLRLGPRRVVHDRGAVGGGLPGRSERVLRLHDGVGGRIARAGRRPADHVRHRRRARPDRAGAAAPARAGAARPRCGSATARGASASSTSTASCSTRCTGSPTGSSTRRPPGGAAGRSRRVGTRRPSSRPATRQFLVELADTAARALAGKGPWHLGGPGRAPPLRLLEADVLGRARPGDRARRPPRRRATASRRGRRPGTRSVTRS